MSVGGRIPERLLLLLLLLSSKHRDGNLFDLDLFYQQVLALLVLVHIRLVLVRIRTLEIGGEEGIVDVDILVLFLFHCHCWPCFCSERNLVHLDFDEHLD